METLKRARPEMLRGSQCHASNLNRKKNLDTHLFVQGFLGGPFVVDTVIF